MAPTSDWDPGVLTCGDLRHTLPSARCDLWSLMAGRWKYGQRPGANTTWWRPRPPPAPWEVLDLADLLWSARNEESVIVTDREGKGWRLDPGIAAADPHLKGPLIHLSEEASEEALQPVRDPSLLELAFMIAWAHGARPDALPPIEPPAWRALSSRHPLARRLRARLKTDSLLLVRQPVDRVIKPGKESSWLAIRNAWDVADEPAQRWLILAHWSDSEQSRWAGVRQVIPPVAFLDACVDGTLNTEEVKVAAFHVGQLSSAVLDDELLPAGVAQVVALLDGREIEHGLRPDTYVEDSVATEVTLRWSAEGPEWVHPKLQGRDADTLRALRAACQDVPLVPEGLFDAIDAAIAARLQADEEAAERERQEAEAARQARIAAREAEAARLAAERAAAEAARIEAERLAAEEAARMEAERLAAEEAARVEAERLAAEEAARVEAERLAAKEAARVEAERLAAEEAARLEAERIEAEEAARAEAERLAAEEAARVEAERLASDEAARIEAEQLAAEEAARLEGERLAAEEAAHVEAERLAAEEAARSEAERQAAEDAARVEAERLAAEEAASAEAERVAAEEEARLEAERLAAEEAAQIEAERIAAEEAARVEAERVAQQEAARLEAERLTAEEAARVEAERLAAEEAARQEAERADAIAAAQAEADREAAEEASRHEAAAANKEAGRQARRDEAAEADAAERVKRMAQEAEQARLDAEEAARQRAKAIAMAMPARTAPAAVAKAPAPVAAADEAPAGGLPVGVWVVGGLIVAGLLAWWLWPSSSETPSASVAATAITSTDAVGGERAVQEAAKEPAPAAEPGVQDEEDPKPAAPDATTDGNATPAAADDAPDAGETTAEAPPKAVAAKGPAPRFARLPWVTLWDGRKLVPEPGVQASCNRYGDIELRRLDKTRFIICDLFHTEPGRPRGNLRRKVCGTDPVRCVDLKTADLSKLPAYICTPKSGYAYGLLKIADPRRAIYVSETANAGDMKGRTTREEWRQSCGGYAPYVFAMEKLR